MTFWGHPSITFWGHPHMVLYITPRDISTNILRASSADILNTSLYVSVCNAKVGKSYRSPEGTSFSDVLKTFLYGSICEDKKRSSRGMDLYLVPPTRIAIVLKQSPKQIYDTEIGKWITRIIYIFFIKKFIEYSFIVCQINKFL